MVLKVPEIDLLLSNVEYTLSNFMFFRKPEVNWSINHISRPLPFSYIIGVHLISKIFNSAYTCLFKGMPLYNYKCKNIIPLVYIIFYLLNSKSLARIIKHNHSLVCCFNRAPSPNSQTVNYPKFQGGNYHKLKLPLCY